MIRQDFGALERGLDGQLLQSLAFVRDMFPHLPPVLLYLITFCKKIK